MFSAALSYTWAKGSVENLVRPSVKWYIFVSSDGTLYFQSVTRDDVGDYICMVTRPDARDNAQGGKTSEPIPLEVTAAGKPFIKLLNLCLNDRFHLIIITYKHTCHSNGHFLG